MRCEVCPWKELEVCPKPCVMGKIEQANLEQSERIRKYLEELNRLALGVGKA